MTNGVCDIQTAAQNMHVLTPLTAWSPLGNGHGPLPYPSTGATFEAGGTQLTAGVHYCVRIRAEGDTDTAGQRVYGDYTFLNDAFRYQPNAPATGNVALPTSSDYLSPSGGIVTGQTPMYTWKPIAGANAYWVIIARDPTFTTLVDYAFTQIPPTSRGGRSPTRQRRITGRLPAALGNGTRCPSCRKPVCRSTRSMLLLPASRGARPPQRCSRPRTAPSLRRSNPRSSGRRFRER